MGGVRIRAIEGVKNKYQQFAKILGKDPKKMVFDAKQLDKTYEHYTSGSLLKVEGGLAELMKGQLPEFVCRNAEKFMAVTSVYTAGFKDSHMAKGGIVILMRNNTALINPKPIEIALGYISELFKRMLAEHETSIKETLLRSSIESAGDIIILSLDRNYRYLYFNETHKNVMKAAYGKMPVTGACIFDYMTNQDDIQKIKKRYDKGLEGDSSVSIDIYGDKEKRYYKVHVNPIRDKKNSIIGITSFSFDITEKQKAEENLKAAFQQLAASEQQLRATNQQLSASEQQLRATNQQLSASEQQLRATNQQLSASEQQLRAINQQLAANKQQLRITNSELATSEKELLEKSQLLNDTAKIARIGGWELDVTTNKVTWSDETYRIHDVPLDRQPPLKEAIDFFHPEERPLLQEALKKAIEKGEPYNLTLRFTSAKGKKLFTRTVCKPEKHNGKVTKLKGTIQDVTELKKAEDALNHSHELMKYVIENSNSAIAIHDKDLNYLYVSQNYLRQYKVKEKDVIGKHHYDVFPDLPQKWKDVHREALLGKVSRGDYDPYEKEDGTIEFTKWECRPWYESDGSIGGIIVYTEIITERVKQERIIEAKNKISQIILSKKEDELYADVLDAVLQIMESKYGVFGYINKEGDLVCPSMTKDIWQECKMMDKTIVFPQNSWGNSMWGNGLRNKKGAYSNKPFKVPEGHLPVERFLTIPLVYQNKSVGLISVGNKATDYNDDDFNLLKEITDYLAPVIAVQQERKQVLESLAKSEEKLNLMIKNSNDIIVLINEKGHQFFISDPVEKITGYTPDELIGPLADLVHPDDLEISTQFFANIMKNKDKTHRLQYRHKHKEKGYVWLEAVGQNHLDNPLINAIIVNIRDITKQKKAKEALIQQEMHLRSMMENPYGYIVYRTRLVRESGEIKVVHASNSFADVLGIPEKDRFNFPKWFIHVHPEDLPQLLEANKDGMKPPFKLNLELRYNHPINGLKWFEIRANGIPYKDDPTMIEYANGIILDITDRKIAHKQLQASEQQLKATNQQLIAESDKLKASEDRYQTLLENSPYMISVVDGNGNYLYVNKTHERDLGYSIDLLMSIAWFDHVHKDDLESLNAAFLKVKETGSAEITYRLKVKSGEYKYIHSKAVAIKGTEHFFIYSQDITKKQRTEKELLKMDKLNSIGTLAGGIAHDFNNILAIIYGNISLLKMELGENHARYDLLEETEKSMGRASKLSKQLLTFSKGGYPVKKEVNLLKLIKETISFDLSGSHLKPVFNFEKDNYSAKVDEGQIQQVLSNLAINAIQASPEGGHLYISVADCVVNEGEILNLKSGQYIKITVRDEGIGIPEKYLHNIFDPYFTTKETGSGLGLATTYSIIIKHEGAIYIDSESGKGTIFTIYLPATQNHEIKENKNIEKISQKHKNKVSAKILVMDDEEGIRKLLARFIKRMGYDYDTVPDGEQAIKKYVESIEQHKPFDIIIMDLTIPGGMGGKKTIKKILETNKNAKVIASSGFSSESSLAEYKSLGFIDILDKPYTMDKLEHVLNRVLESK